MGSVAVVIVGIVVLAGVGVVLLGVFYPGSGADQLDWKPTRSPEVEARNEVDDLDQMTEAVNAKRRARGAGELTRGEIDGQIGRDHRELAGLAAEGQAAADEEIEALLELGNRRRRARGEPELTRADFERPPGRGGEPG